MHFAGGMVYCQLVKVISLLVQTTPDICTSIHLRLHARTQGHDRDEITREASFKSDMFVKS